MASAENPILNTPYAEPTRHYATDVQGNLNYKDVRQGRRVFAPDVPQVPVGQQAQGSMFDVNDLRAEYGEHLVNQARDAVREWRQSGYRGVTSRVTRDLLTYWFANAEREAHQSCSSRSKKRLKPRSGSTKSLKYPMPAPTSSTSFASASKRQGMPPPISCRARPTKWPPAPARRSSWPVSSFTTT